MCISWVLLGAWAILGLPFRKMSFVAAGEEESLTGVHNSKASCFHGIFRSFQVFFVVF